MAAPACRSRPEQSFEGIDLPGLNDTVGPISRGIGRVQASHGVSMRDNRPYGA